MIKKGLFTPIMETIYYDTQLPQLKKLGHKLYKSKYKCTICNKKWNFQWLGAYICSPECLEKLRTLLRELYLDKKEKIK